MKENTMNKNMSRLKYRYIVFNGDHNYDGFDLLKKNDRDFFKLRRSIENKESTLSCEGCGGDLRISQGTKKQPHFYHADRLKAETCEFHKFLASKKGEIYNGESKGHREAKHFIANKYRDEGYTVDVEKTIKSTLPNSKGYRRPDIFIVELNLAIEVQKAWIGIKDIAAREAFFKENSYSLLWVFLNDSRVSKSSVKDIRYGSKSLEQVFLFNIYTARKQKKLEFFVIYTNTFGLRAKTSVMAEKIIAKPSELAYARIQNCKNTLCYEIENEIPFLKGKDKEKAIRVMDRVKRNKGDFLQRHDAVFLSKVLKGAKVDLIKLTKNQIQSQVMQLEKIHPLTYPLFNQLLSSEMMSFKYKVKGFKRRDRISIYVNMCKKRIIENKKEEERLEVQRKATKEKKTKRELKIKLLRTTMNKNQLNGTLSKFCESLYKEKSINVPCHTEYSLIKAFRKYLERGDKLRGENRADAFSERLDQQETAIKYIKSYASGYGCNVY